MPDGCTTCLYFGGDELPCRVPGCAGAEFDDEFLEYEFETLLPAPGAAAASHASPSNPMPGAGTSCEGE
jgi:hypothetical protein